MAARPAKRKRENGRQRLERELGAYLGFWQEIRGDEPMLTAYPQSERTGLALSRRIKQSRKAA
jgi:hypothetical protein